MIVDHVERFMDKDLDDCSAGELRTMIDILAASLEYEKKEASHKDMLHFGELCDAHRPWLSRMLFGKLGGVR